MAQRADPNLMGDFSLELCEAEGVEQCFRALSRAVEKLGFDGIVYTAILTKLRPNPPVGPLFLHSDGYDKKFLAHYEQAGFAEHDFTIKRIQKGDLSPMDWWEEEQKGVLKADEKTVIQVARHDYSLSNGVSIPTQCSEGRIAGASIISTEDRLAFLRVLHERLPTLRCMVRLFHDRVQNDPQCSKLFLLPFLQDLSEKERKILKFMSTELHLKVIEDHCGITSGYAKNLMVDLYKKFEVKNGNRLRYLLGLYGILDAL